ncbi:hypothetical protein NFI96_007497 [Prochilodus magdalenae]|nr:hypothetical protein NFI96_007497 [Prochilodus magdalenae]
MFYHSYMLCLDMQSFRICSWNIQGLYSTAFGAKSAGLEFLKIIQHVDIVILLETWCRDDVPTHCPSGYSEVVLPSFKRPEITKGRDSAGALVWYKQELSRSVTVIKKAKTYLWLKLNQNLQITDTDLFLCAIYTPPLESPYFDPNFFEDLQADITLFQAQGNVLLIGDFNARTGTEPDIINTHGNKHVFGHSVLFSAPTELKRNSLDSTVNRSGKELLHLCQTSGLFILNGRVRGDSMGRPTYCSAQGCSVVDYAVTDMDPHNISAFTVMKQTPLSDHCPVQIFFKPSNQSIQEAKPSKLYHLHRPYRWAPNSADKFLEMLRSAEVTDKITSFSNAQYLPNKEGVNLAVRDITGIFTTAAVRSNLRQRKRKPKQHDQTEKWFDKEWLYYRILQSGVGGKVYHIIKHMYTENKCAVKIGDKRTEYFRQGRGVRQGCSLSPTLFNIYINELATQLDRSAAPGLMLCDTEVRFLLYADDLVLLSPTQQGLQQMLDQLQTHCQTWALAVNQTKTNIMIFQKKPRVQDTRYPFKLGSTILTHTLHYTYLGLTISASGSFHTAVTALREKACRALFAIRNKTYKVEIPVRIWSKLFDSIIQPIALYGSEIWGPLSDINYSRWDKHPIETLHAEFCRKILRVQRHTPNNACRAELGRFPLALQIQKRALKFWIHLTQSSPDALHFKALQVQKLNPEKSPLCQLVSELTCQLPSDRLGAQTRSAKHIQIRRVITQTQKSYLEHWDSKTRQQHKLSCYRTLRQGYTLAPYLLSVRDSQQRHVLTKYRLSDHSLAIERGRHRHTWLPREERVCGHCGSGEVETETHFLLHCQRYMHIRDRYLKKFNIETPGFSELPETEKLRVLLGEGRNPALAGRSLLGN